MLPYTGLHCDSLAQRITLWFSLTEDYIVIFFGKGLHCESMTKWTYTSKPWPNQFTKAKHKYMSQWRHSMTKRVYEGKPSPNELWRQTITKRAHEINPWLKELTKANHDWTSLREQTMTKWFHEGEARPNDFMKANHDQMTSWKRTMTKWFHEGGEPWPSDFMKALCVSLCTSFSHQLKSQSMLNGFQ